MSRAKKNSVPFSCNLEREVYEKLTDFCNETGVSKTAAVERALLMFVADYNKKQQLTTKAAYSEGED